MIDYNTINVGDKVYYHPPYKSIDMIENGIVKEIPSHTTTEVRVVFHCDNNWDNYSQYTSALTPIKDLYLGWL